MQEQRLLLNEDLDSFRAFEGLLQLIFLNYRKFQLSRAYVTRRCHAAAVGKTLVSGVDNRRVKYHQKVELLAQASNYRKTYCMVKPTQSSVPYIVSL